MQGTSHEPYTSHDILAGNLFLLSHIFLPSSSVNLAPCFTLTDNVDCDTADHCPQHVGRDALVNAAVPNVGDHKTEGVRDGMDGVAGRQGHGGFGFTPRDDGVWFSRDIATQGYDGSDSNV